MRVRDIVSIILLGYRHAILSHSVSLNMNTLSQQAFATYCDVVIRDAKAKSDTIVQKMKPFHENLNSAIVFFKGKALLKKLNVLEYDDNNEEDDEYFVYVVKDSDPFPFEEMHMLCGFVSGVSFGDPMGLESRKDPVVTILHDRDLPSAEVVIHLDRVMKLTGTLTNFVGSLEAVQEMIDNNHFQCIVFSNGTVSIASIPVIWLLEK